MLAQDLVQWRLRIDRTRIDRQAGPLSWKADFGLGKSKLVTGKVHQVRTVLAIMNGKIHVQTNLFGIDPQQPRPDPVERAGPGKRVGENPGIGAKHLIAYTLDTPRHL